MAIGIAEVYQQLRQIDDVAQRIAQENIALKKENEQLKAKIKELESGGSVPEKRLSE